MTNASYFDVLTAEDARNVFRYLATRPDAKDRPQFVPTGYWQAMYIGAGAVSELCRRVFTTICIHESFRREDTGGDCLVISFDSEVLRKVIRAGRHRIMRLVVDDLESEKEKRLLKSNIQGYCVNLKELRVRFRGSFDLKSLILSPPSQLRALSLDKKPSEKETVAIAKRCKNLRQLEIGFPDHDMELFFGSIGLPLQHHKVFGEASSSKFLRQVKAFSRNLRTLDFDEVTQDLGSVLVDLVLNSSQLQKLVLGNHENCFFLGTLYVALTELQEFASKIPDLDDFISCGWRNSAANLWSGFGRGRMAIDAKALKTTSKKFKELCRMSFDREKSMMPLAEGSVCSLIIEMSRSDDLMDEVQLELDDNYEGVSEDDRPSLNE